MKENNQGYGNGNMQQGYGNPQANYGNGNMQQGYGNPQANYGNGNMQQGYGNPQANYGNGNMQQGFRNHQIGNRNGNIQSEYRSPKTKGNKAGLIIGIVAGAVVLFFVLGMIIIGALRNKFKDDYSGSHSSTGGGLITDDDSDDMMLIEKERFSFEINKNWTKYSEDKDVYIPDDEKGQAYGLMGVSNLGNFTEEEFFDDLINYYKENNSMTVLEQDDILRDSTTAEGDTYKCGRILMTDNNTKFEVEVLMSYDKNLAITFQGQCKADDDLKYKVSDIVETVSFKDETIDISGKHFIQGDNSEIVFEGDGRFKYYEVAGDYNSSYYDGSYEVYTGKAAIDKTVSFEEYGLTEEELYETLGHNMNNDVSLDSDSIIQSSGPVYHVCLDNFYAIVLQNEKIMMDTGEEIENDNQILYVGYYIPEIETFSLTNCFAANHVNWVLED
ncbi:MAG: hypothetical protein K6E10_02075 [Eubacterium sp.]|nr:hypothetical protein [Eubacterium sp.]